MSFFWRQRNILYTGGGKKKKDSGSVTRKRKSSKKKQQRKEGLKHLEVEMVKKEISKEPAESSNAPRKKSNSSWLEFRAEVGKLEEEVAVRRAETSLMRQQLMEAETNLEASRGTVTELRMIKDQLLLENLRDQSLVNDLTRLFLD
ncbi:uncharacterized protein LOC111276607 [Durio zibethinus]|uniref:Uncharacterized protein LOC111276607 n=1 Tax=Durio zibethinus TaxID=66656 RepID=A0A6P5WPZ6_DURZI|nr:uncharacterized protein LOC111276607 [Durio zibethinus]